MFFLRRNWLGCCPNILGGGGVFGDNHATSGSFWGAASAKENVTNLNINPATDETIFTTDSGIEIKSHNASASGAESTIQYFTLGSYNGTPVNWLIVGFGEGCAPDTSPAGAAIVADHANQKFVGGGTSSDLEPNQILCISEYAFNQETYTADFTPHGQVYDNYVTSASEYAYTTDQLSDYYASYTDPSADIDAKSATLGTMLGINEYYGSGNGKIVVNSSFSSNYVFSLSLSQYTTFVSSTNNKVAYLASSTSTATDIWVSDPTFEGNVTSKGYGNRYVSNGYTVAGSGAATAELRLITVNGLSGTVTAANFKASFSQGSSYNGAGNIYWNFYTNYSVTNNPIPIAYRPAFVLQI